MGKSSSRNHITGFICYHGIMECKASQGIGYRIWGQLFVQHSLLFTATLFDISVTVFVFVLQEISLTLLSLYTRPKVILFSHLMVTTVS